MRVETNSFKKQKLPYVTSLSLDFARDISPCTPVAEPLVRYGAGWRE